MIGTFISGARSSLKPPSARSPASAVRRKSIVSEIFVSGFSNGIPFQPSMMRSEEAPMPSAKRPREASASGGGLLRQQRPPALHDADDAGAEADASRSRPRPGRAA